MITTFSAFLYLVASVPTVIIFPLKTATVRALKLLITGIVNINYRWNGIEV